MANEKDNLNEGMMSEVRTREVDGLAFKTRVIVRQDMEFRINDGYVLRKVGQAFMVMPTGARMKNYQGMITLNDTGAFIFEQMKKPGATRDGVIEACVAEYKCTEEEAKQAVTVFLAQASECGLIPYKEAYIDLATQQEITQEEADVIAREEAEAKLKFQREQAEKEKEQEANESKQSE